MDTQKNESDSPHEYHIQSPHDHIFIESMQYFEIAHGIAKIILPANIALCIDLDTLELTNGDIIDDHLNEHRTDIVYRAKLFKTDQWVYLLFEHKSDKDEKIHKQLFYYMNDIWNQLEKQKPSIKKIPVVISMVVYHGDTPWEIANSRKTLFAIIEEIECFLPDFKTLMLDLSNYDLAQIADSKLKMLLLALKYSRKPEILEILPQIIRMPEKFKGIGNDDYLLVILVYLGSVLKGSRYKEFWRIIAREHRDGEVYMETIADVLRKEERLKREKMEKLLREEIKRKDTELERKNSKLEQKDTEIEQKNTEIEQKNTEIEQKRTEIEQKRTALHEEMKNKEIALVDIVKRMLDDEMSVQMIQKITGLSNRKIEKIRQNNKID